jgi:hypothetical protein
MSTHNCNLLRELLLTGGFASSSAHQIYYVPHPPPAALIKVVQDARYNSEKTFHWPGERVNFHLSYHFS